MERVVTVAEVERLERENAMLVEVIRRAGEIVDRGLTTMINGSCNVPGYRTSVDIRFYDDDWLDLRTLIGYQSRGPARDAHPDGARLAPDAE